MRDNIDEEPWKKSLTGSLRDSQIGYLLYSKPEDIARMLSQVNSSVVTNTLLEYTQRGEWRKAAQVARRLVGGNPDRKGQIETIFGAAGIKRLLEYPFEDLTSVIYK